MSLLTDLPAHADPNNLPPYPKSELIYVELAPVSFLPVDLHFILGAVQERADAAAEVGVSYGLADFIREALIEQAHR